MSYTRFLWLALALLPAGILPVPVSGAEGPELARFVRLDGTAFEARFYGYEAGKFLTGQEVKPGIYRSETLAASQIAAITPAHTMKDILAEYRRQADLRAQISDVVRRHNMLADAIGGAPRAEPDPALDPAEVGWDEVALQSGRSLAGEMVALASGQVRFRERRGARFEERTLPLEQVESLWLTDRAADLARFRHRAERLAERAREDEAALQEMVARVKSMIERAKQMAATPPPAIDSPAGEMPAQPWTRRRLEVQRMQHRSGHEFNELLREISWYYGAATEIQRRNQDAAQR